MVRACFTWPRTASWWATGRRNRRNRVRGVALHTDDTAGRRIDALYRAGIVLAGANMHRTDDDGILTAAEVAWLDLAGTELVVLSACETGMGETGAGGGVYGLQQSLITAGARSIVMSLWNVDDSATNDLMVRFYAGLSQGEGRSDALRNAQLAMLGESARAHPYYWAGFIHYGDGSSLPSMPPPPGRQGEPPSFSAPGARPVAPDARAR
jgi:hypothetical protein